MLDATQDAGGGDVNVPCTCTHVGKKDAADSLLKFKRALNADATLFINGGVTNHLQVLG